MATINWGRLILYVVLFAIAAGTMFLVLGALIAFTSFFLWCIVPPGLIYGAFIFLSFVLFGALFFLAHRKRWGSLKAISLGGVAIPALVVALLLIHPWLPDRPCVQKPNQQDTVISPSGKYVLTVPIERSQREKGPFGYGMPYWYVTISASDGRVLYRDLDENFDAIHNVYWIWDERDRVWLYNSDDGAVYFYEQADTTWSKRRWGDGRNEPNLAPPQALYPSYLSNRPVKSLETFRTIIPPRRVTDRK